MTARDDLSCIEFVEIITEYLEGTMPAEERIRFEDHLSACDGCTIYLEQMRQTIRLAGRLSETQISPEVHKHLLTAFQKFMNKQD
jgi:anti-sigma factor RsiW